MDGFEQTWLYYTSYAGFWRLSAPDLDAFRAQANFNLMELLKHPAAACFLLPAEGFVSPLLAIFAVALGFGVLRGVWLRGRSHGCSVLHLSAAAFVPIVLVWNFTLMDRFWLPFLPLLLAGASFELRNLAAAIRKTADGPRDQRVAAAAMGALAVGLLAYAGYRYAWEVRADRRAALTERSLLLADKRQAYSWLAEHAGAKPAISYEDALAYLYSGVQGLRPLQPSPQSFYEQSQEIFDRDLAKLGDAARTLDASFWIVSADDYGLASQMRELRDATRAELADEPVVFESADGLVRIHQLSFNSQARMRNHLPQ